ncbi:MAG TPA: putative sulfate exporter family transporter [Alphaproteobacteria bacterium]|nr:putative sulfate exporter family transporter [Alphaproteobacteria bacterium]
MLARLPARARGLFPGVAISIVIALASLAISDHYGGPVMLYALLIGMAFNFTTENPRIVEGLTFTARGVLRLGVGLLGARITLGQIVELGPVPPLLVVAAVVLTLLFGQALGRALRLGRLHAVLSAGAVAICGVSAALTISSVLPKREGGERETIFVCLAVTALSTLCMIAYPFLLRLVGFDLKTSGVFLGATIHDVAQVVGAGLLMSPETGSIATFTKLMRVAMLVPVVLALSLLLARRRAEGGGRVPVGLPWFLNLFVLIVAVNSLGWIPQGVVQTFDLVSRACLVAAIAAIGVRTSFRELAVLGWQPLALVVGNTLFIAVLALAVLSLFPVG